MKQHQREECVANSWLLLSQQRLGVWCTKSRQHGNIVFLGLFSVHLFAKQVVTAGVDAVAAVLQVWEVEVVVVEVATGVVCWEAEEAPDMVTEVTDMAQQDSPVMSAACLIGSRDQALSGNSRIPTCNPLASSPQGGWTTGGSSLARAITFCCSLFAL